MTNTNPTFRQRIVSYRDARTRWHEAGKPVRTDEQVTDIYKNICVPCENFLKRRGGGACKLCGCRLNLGTRINKLRWATESCPIGKWEADVQVAEKKETPRQKRIRERNERVAARNTRVEARNKRISQRRQDEYMLGGEKPPVISLPENADPLHVYDRDKQRVDCLRNLWAANPSAFLVCGGPSLQKIDLSKLATRGVMSLGVNNVAAYAPVKAFTCGDPPEKFHHGIWLSGDILKIVPAGKLKQCVRAKLPNGTFRWTSYHVRHCSNVWAYRRRDVWMPGEFFTTEWATLGRGGKEGTKLEPNKPTIIFTFFAALRLMHYLGIRRVYLLGVDFAMTPDSGYAFNQKRTEGACRGNNNSYRIATAMLEELLPTFERHSYEVFNCNPESHLPLFPHVPFEDAFEDCRGPVPESPWDTNRYYEKPGDPNDEERQEEESSEPGRDHQAAGT